MKKMNVAFATVFFCLLMAGNGWAASFDSVEPWFNSQNDGFFVETRTTDQNEFDNVTVALRAQERHVRPIPNSGTEGGIAIFDAATGVGDEGYALWNFDLFVDARGWDGLPAATLKVEFTPESGSDSSQWYLVDILFQDPPKTRIASENLGFCHLEPDWFDPYAEGEYLFTLTLRDHCEDPLRVQMMVRTSAVPVPAAGLLLGSGLLGLIGWRRREMA